MGRLNTGSPNELLATEVLVVRENMVSWVWLNPMLGARRVGLFLSEPVSWSFSGGQREEDIGIIRFRTLSSAIHSIGTEE